MNKRLYTPLDYREAKLFVGLWFTYRSKNARNRRVIEIIEIDQYGDCIYVEKSLINKDIDSNGLTFGEQGLVVDKTNVGIGKGKGRLIYNNIHLLCGYPSLGTPVELWDPRGFNWSVTLQSQVYSKTL